MKYKLVNGWTKETVMLQIKKYNNGERAMSKTDLNVCTYQAEDGNRCAVGCFIPDTHVEVLNAPFDICTLMMLYPKLQKYVPFEILVKRLAYQMAHDRCGFDTVHTAIESFLKNKVE